MKTDTCRICGKRITDTTDHLATAHPLITLAGLLVLSPLIVALAIAGKPAKNRSHNAQRFGRL